jgi:hypothetical protein
MSAQIPKTRGDEMREVFEDAHRECPALFERYCAVTLDFIAHGINGLPIAMLSPQLPLLVIRATSRIGDHREGKFLVNNNHGRFYADLFRARYPQHAHVFGKRWRTSEAQPPTNLPELGPADFETGE